MAPLNPVTLIIGMGPGLSGAIAQKFANGGYTIVGLARHPEKSAELAVRMAERGHRLELRNADASNFASLGSAIAEVETTLGPVEVLIYNAYRATYALPSQVPVDELMADAAVNIGGALASVQAVLPAMRLRGHGTILLTGGGLALDPTGWLPAASLAVGKAGIRSLALTLNKELAEAGIRVATVTVAGMIAQETDFAPEFIADTYWRLHRMKEPVPAEQIYAGRGSEHAIETQAR